MAIISYTSEEQARQKVNDREIFEKKPIGFSGDDGLLRPYSNLFYWTYKWTEKGGEIAEQPYKGFEILTFVLKGEIDHYDNNFRGWKKLTAGDFQVIRSGNGFINSERFMPGTSLLQIWTDPDFEKSLNQPSSYDDYSSDCFPSIIEKGKSVKIYLGNDSPANIQTSGLIIKELFLAQGTHSYEADRESFVSGFVIDGNAIIRKNNLRPYTFFIAKEEDGFQINAVTDCRLFVIESPLEPDYSTHAEKYII